MGVFTSCDDFLDITPKGEVVPTTYEDYSRVLASAYYNAVNTGNSNLALRTDEVLLNESDANKQYIEDIYAWKDDAQSQVTSEYVYESVYRNIALTNQIINEFSYNENLDEEKQLMGEAFAMRAYMHYKLLNMYAKPYNASTAASDQAPPMYTKIDVEQLFPKTTVETMYNFIEEDLKKAEELINVEVYETSDKFKFSKKALNSFFARFYLFKNDLEKANDYAKLVKADVDFSELIEDYLVADHPLAYNYNSKENILAIEHFFRFRNEEVYASDFIFGLYNEKDNRRAELFDFTTEDVDDGAGGTITQIVKPVKIKKYSDNANRCSFRYSEILFIMAEYEAKLGTVKNAGDILKKLLEKRLAADLYTAEAAILDGITDRTVMMNYILAEKAREFAFEDHRWFDLRRTNQKEITHSLDGTDYVLKANDARYTLRYPQSAIKANPKLLD
jgi:hypothetical protein